MQVVQIGALAHGLPLACAPAHHRGAEVYHTHDCYELVYVLSGSGLHQIDDRTYPILAGDCYLMRPGDTHRYTSDGIRIVNVLFLESLFARPEWSELASLPGLAPFLTEASHRHKLSLSPPHDHEVASRCERLRRELAERRPGFAIGAKAILVDLLLTLDRLAVALRRPAEPVEGPPPGAVASSLALIHERFGTPLTVAELAREAGLTPNYFGERFARELGMPVHAYLNRLRVEKARELLERTDDPVTDIALGVGFDTCSYFGKVFRQHTGYTPRAYRKSVRAR
jgi:AraC family L-rhamnose operon transcriptional activator RhaR/AraC family L-rhamnose operon regulatory protein RhaS